MAPSTYYSIDSQSGVALLYLSNPPVNALHPSLLSSFAENMALLQADASVKAIIITGEGPSAFSAGFDIPQFVKLQSGSGAKLPDVNAMLTALVENGPKPTVAAIKGSALGGGCEVAMATNARVATAKSVLGLPELQLGVIPGFGGTQRLPRLVGIQKAMEMMLTSKPLKAVEAKNRGLVDVVVANDDDLLPAAKQLALAMANGTTPRTCALSKTDKIGPPMAARAMVQLGRMQVAKNTPPGMKHPSMCLDAILVGATEGPEAGIKKEAEVFAEVVQHDVSKSLVHVFLSQRLTSKIRGVTDSGLRPRPMKCVAIIGGGLMGSGIATACVLNGIDVVLKEVNQKFLEGGMQRVAANLMSSVKKGRMTKEKYEQCMSRLKGTITYEGFDRADMVIEAALEDIGLKQKIFAELEQVCRKDCILSTNTSTIDINVVGAKTNAINRIIGNHFFSPAHVMKLLEIIKTDSTDKQVILDTIAFGKAIKKVPVVVGNCTGFAVNRVFFPYTMAACLLVDLGVDPYRIDKVIKAFGMPMGPLRLADLVGIEVGVHVGGQFVQNFSDRTYASELMHRMRDGDRLGEKNKKGFYNYDAKRRATPAGRDVEAILAASGAALDAKAANTAAQLRQIKQKVRSFSDKDIVDFIMLPVVNESSRVVAEGIVDKASDLDIASVLSMGFPPYRGGPIKMADLRGAASVRDRLASFAAMFTPVGLGGFFEPCDYLQSCARAGVTLADGRSALGTQMARL